MGIHPVCIFFRLHRIVLEKWLIRGLRLAMALYGVSMRILSIGRVQNQIETLCPGHISMCCQAKPNEILTIFKENTNYAHSFVVL